MTEADASGQKGQASPHVLFPFGRCVYVMIDVFNDHSSPDDAFLFDFNVCIIPIIKPKLEPCGIAGAVDLD